MSDGLTDPDKIAAAAQWLADNWHVAPQPFTRTLREMFGLAFPDACKAMAEAKRIHERADAVR
ncbi:hypothetical protein [Devosia sp.]|uniref:hypothetical protein n=1 Tax=Devosia sp. TaxID=1871048 RepID=UPI0027362B79|nr:hypothetical protein [Devosia sp.]MDP2779846.1 hypothetical protein [Devosia sp.]